MRMATENSFHVRKILITIPIEDLAMLLKLNLKDARQDHDLN